MTPIYFGSRERRLFGVYEPAQAKGRPRRAALLCHPWGTEHLISYRPIRFLAGRLAASGFDVLRFDYFGAGDSGGETTDATLSGWRQDIATAMDELLDMSQARSAALVGLRLGATLAAQVAPRLPPSVRQIVLWDPIRLGPDYFAELSERGDPLTRRAAAPDESIGTLDGLLVSALFRSELQALDLSASPIPHDQDCLAIETKTGAPRASRLPWQDDARARMTVVESDSIPIWIHDDKRVGVLPVEVVSLIIDWLK
jgi:pimeloyl-ACP methyl ester carboxylesterase